MNFCYTHWALGVFHSICSFFVVYLINKHQPTAYMDEYFHEKQTRIYIHGHWKVWDPKITTPPGLYLLVTMLSKLLPTMEFSVQHFRFINPVISGINNLLLLHLLHSYIIPTSRHFVIYAISLTSLPVLYFTSVIYYTDQFSLMVVLLMFFCQFRGNTRYAFVFSCLACFVRQTNIIWCLFLVGNNVATRLSSVVSENPKTTHFVSHWLSLLFRLAIYKPRMLLNCIKIALFQDSPLYLITCVLFIVFVKLNNGIVLGDKTAHQFTLHIPQLFYFFVFCAFHTPLEFVRFIATLPSTVKKWCTTKQSCGIFLLGSLAFLIFAGCSVHWFTFEHKYLLADNRHYTFYVWQRSFRRYASFRYFMVPVYFVTGAFLISTFVPIDGRACRLINLLQLAVFLLTSALCLVPSSLLEFRYFIIPFIVWRLFSAGSNAFSNRQTSVSEASLNCIINALTVYLFIYRTFEWQSEPNTVQRFMW